MHRVRYDAACPGEGMASPVPVGACPLGRIAREKPEPYT